MQTLKYSLSLSLFALAACNCFRCSHCAVIVPFSYLMELRPNSKTSDSTSRPKPLPLRLLRLVRFCAFRLASLRAGKPKGRPFARLFTATTQRTSKYYRTPQRYKQFLILQYFIKKNCNLFSNPTFAVPFFLSFTLFLFFDIDTI